ncbi:hypothetical protein D9M72_466660 [compost metagenome]
MALLAPTQLKQARSFGAGASNGMDQREILRQQRFARYHRDIGLVVGGKRAECRFERLGTHVVGWRVDQVARKEDAGELPLDIGRIGVGGDQQCRRLALGGFVALEAIGTEAIAERQPVGGERRGFDVPLACRQCSRKLAGQKRRFRRVAAETEERTAEMAV